MAICTEFKFYMPRTPMKMINLMHTKTCKYKYLGNTLWFIGTGDDVCVWCSRYNDVGNIYYAKRGQRLSFGKQLTISFFAL